MPRRWSFRALSHPTMARKWEDAPSQTLGGSLNGMVGPAISLWRIALDLQRLRSPAVDCVVWRHRIAGY